MIDTIIVAGYLFWPLVFLAYVLVAVIMAYFVYFKTGDKLFTVIYALVWPITLVAIIIILFLRAMDDE